MPFDLDTKLRAWLEDPFLRAGVVLFAALIVAVITRFIMTRWLKRLAAKTETDVDDQIIEVLERPIFISVLLAGIVWAITGFELAVGVRFVAFAALKTMAVITWTSAAMRVGALLLGMLSRTSEHLQLVQPRTLPLFETLLKIVAVGGAIYFGFLAWHIDVTGWLASAGIVGIAVGFAAKDTLANLFAGIFILADAPYKLGDFIVLGDGERGCVTDIGIRSTRILTRDDIEITVPNSVIANAKLINETGGPHPLERVRVTVDVAYGSDIDQVREVLMGCAKGVEHVCTEHEPRVRFREFGDSGLRFQFMAWIDEPVLRGRTLDALNTRVYNELRRAGIAIPFPQRDVHIKEHAGRARD
ncbi:MAG: mechanosensitive ion channel family protein [Deltaproteobacteria bacterium]|nr:MAG: mechanosensitive ion channel family protein [Deltaproteobacteria bacterium]